APAARARAGALRSLPLLRGGDRPQAPGGDALRGALRGLPGQRRRPPPHGAPPPHRLLLTGAPARTDEPAPAGQPSAAAASYAAMTSGGACTSSISTPSPQRGKSSLPLGWMKQTSCPAAPLRIPPGVKRTPCPSRCWTA